jgi:hypothetical protein
MSGETIEIDSDEITLVDAAVVTKLLNEKANQVINTNKIKEVVEEEDDDAEDDAVNDAEDDAENDAVPRDEEMIILEDEFDDTYAERPDDYVPIIEPTIEVVDDGWPF